MIVIEKALYDLPYGLNDVAEDFNSDSTSLKRQTVKMSFRKVLDALGLERDIPRVSRGFRSVVSALY